MGFIESARHREKQVCDFSRRSAGRLSGKLTDLASNYKERTVQAGKFVNKHRVFAGATALAAFGVVSKLLPPEPVSAQGTIPPPPPVEQSKGNYLPIVSNDTAFAGEYNVFLPAVSGPGSAEIESEEVRVGTFNAHDKNLDSIEPVVRDMVNGGADFIAFQEVFPPDVDVLTNNLGMDCKVGSGNIAICDTNRKDSDRQDSDWGFSGSVVVHELTEPSGRVVLCAQIAKDGKPPSAVFCGTHLVHTNAEAQLGQATQFLRNQVLTGAAFSSDSTVPQDHEPLPAVLALDSNIQAKETFLSVAGLPNNLVTCDDEAVPCAGEVNPIRGPVDRIAVYPNPMDPLQMLSINLEDSTRGVIVPQSDHTYAMTTMKVTEHVGVAEAPNVVTAQNIYYYQAP